MTEPGRWAIAAGVYSGMAMFFALILPAMAENPAGRSYPIAIAGFVLTLVGEVCALGVVGISIRRIWRLTHVA